MENWASFKSVKRWNLFDVTYENEIADKANWASFKSVKRWSLFDVTYENEIADKAMLQRNINQKIFLVKIDIMLYFVLMIKKKKIQV